jgi:hypothetical protein
MLEDLTVAKDGLNLHARVWRKDSDAGPALHLKLYVLGELLPLSASLPVFESLGLKVIAEDSFPVSFNVDGGWRQENAPAATTVPFHQVDLSSLPAPHVRGAFEQAAAALQAGFDLSAGPLTRLCLFDAGGVGAGQPARLLWATHHLVVDGVSWRLLLEDLEGAYRQATRGLRPTFPPKTTSFQEWAGRLAEHAGSEVLARELEYWRESARIAVLRLPVDLPSGGGDLVGILGVGMLLLGVVLMLVMRTLRPAFFRGEVLPMGVNKGDLDTKALFIK